MSCERRDMSMKHYSFEEHELDDSLSELAKVRRNQTNRENSWSVISTAIKKNQNRSKLDRLIKQSMYTLSAIALLITIWWGYPAIHDLFEKNHLAQHTGHPTQEHIIGIGLDNNPIDESINISDIELDASDEFEDNMNPVSPAPDHTQNITFTNRTSPFKQEFVETFSLDLEEYGMVTGQSLNEKLNTNRSLLQIDSSILAEQQRGDMKPYYYFHHSEKNGYILVKKADKTRDLYTIERVDDEWQVTFFERVTPDGRYLSRWGSFDKDKLSNISHMSYAQTHAQQTSYQRGQQPEYIELNDHIKITNTNKGLLIRYDENELIIPIEERAITLMEAEISQDQNYLTVEVAINKNRMTTYLIDLSAARYVQLFPDEMALLSVWAPSNQTLLIGRGELGKMEIGIYDPTTKAYTPLIENLYNVIALSWGREATFIDYVLEKDDFDAPASVSAEKDANQYIVYPFSLERYDLSTARSDKLLDLSVEEVKHYLNSFIRPIRSNSHFRVQYEAY